jgi:dynein heavy chain
VSFTGLIVDNHELIATLENTKSKAVEIQGKIQQAQTTQEVNIVLLDYASAYADIKQEISLARSVYTPVAMRGSILYFSIAGLATISSMYEVSLDSFLGMSVLFLFSGTPHNLFDRRVPQLFGDREEGWIA